MADEPTDLNLVGCPNPPTAWQESGGGFTLTSPGLDHVLPYADIDLHQLRAGFGGHLDAAHVPGRRQRHALAMLEERERLFAEVHERVLHALKLVAARAARRQRCAAAPAWRPQGCAVPCPAPAPAACASGWPASPESGPPRAGRSTSWTTNWMGAGGGVVRHGGEPVTLHRLLRGRQHTVLILAGSSPDVLRAAGEVASMLERYSNEVRILAVVRGRESDLDGFDVAQDLNGEAHCGYGGPGAMHLLRPDGYLAASGLGDVEAYLMRVYGPRAAGAPAGTRLEPCSSPNQRRPSRGS